MHFKIEGADRATGREINRIIEADSAEIARARAAVTMLISTVCRLPDAGTGAVALAEGDDVDGPSQDDLSSLAGAAQLSYASRILPGAKVPEYQGIISGAAVLQSIYWALVVVAVLYAVGGSIFGVWVARDMSMGAGIGVIVGSAIAALVMGAVAALFRMVAECGLALRDLTRNSFRR
jgi:hypothetical protein